MLQELADLPHSEEPSPSDLEVQQEPWRFAAVEGDAPAAGDGLQVAQGAAGGGRATHGLCKRVLSLQVWLNLPRLPPVCCLL